MNEEKLSMSFDPNTIQHLGIKMYSNLPAAIAELIANSYDADAHEVNIKLCDSDSGKTLSVEDDGHGMSFDDINNYFLRIGRNRRNESMEKTPEGRTATGKKGLGKLALFGIGSEIRVVTKKKNEHERVFFSMKWDDIQKCGGKVYEPTFEREHDNSDDGYTKITISNLKRKSDFDTKALAQSLAKMFNLFDSNFQVTLYLNDQNACGIDNDLKYSGIDEQFKWIYPDDFSDFESDYINKLDVNGTILTTEKPLKASLRGITLFANGRMVNLPEFFGRPESSHFYSYTTGWLNVDFIDKDSSIGEDDLISTNRQSLDWEKEETADLHNFLQDLLAYVQRNWRVKRKEINKSKTKATTGIDREQWLSSVPEDKAKIITDALDVLAEPDEKENVVAVLERAFHDIVPEYAQLHWRFLNSAITQSVSIKRLYQQENYFQAASEAVKMYIAEIRKISGSQNQSDHNMMMEVFDWKAEKALISLTNRLDPIENDIEAGQKFYSGGVVTGFKNPVASHATEDELKRRGLFSEKDCLDILSLLSHLFDRLEKRVSPR